MLVRLIRIAAYIWITLAVIVMLLSYAWIVYTKGFGALQEMLSPFNFANLVATVIGLGPGLLLLALADRIKRGQRPWALLALLPVSLALIVGLYMLTTSGRSGSRQDSDSKVREYKATSIRVRNGSATMWQDKNLLITQTRGPVGTQGIPETINIGDVVTVDGKPIRVKHIFVTEFLQDMRWGKETLGRKGDVKCVIVESEENLPYGDEKQRNRLWINVKECEPLLREQS